MHSPDAEKWNAIYQAGGHNKACPARVLVDFKHLLPQHGTALDLACGTGANAMLLAQHGLQTSAWDISEAAIKQLDQQTQLHKLKISTQIRDVVMAPPERGGFDIIVVSYFLDRGLFPALINGLKHDGLLFYQTYTKEYVNDTGPRNPAYRLDPNELLQLCRDLHIIYYHEEGRIGNSKKGFRNEAMLIGQRRLNN